MLKFDEMYTRLPIEGSPVRTHYEAYERWLARQPAEMMKARREEAEMIFRRVGITFAVYGAKDEDGAGTERLIPFDLIPRIIPAHEWQSMEKGLVQRVTALNRFIHDVYHDQDIIRAGVIPAEQILNNAQFRSVMMGVDVPNNIYSQISGIDIVRAPNASGEGENPEEEPTQDEGQEIQEGQEAQDATGEEEAEAGDEYEPETSEATTEKLNQ